MPSKKKTTRAAQLQPQPLHSDYETDTANATDSAPPMAPPPVRTNTELNLAVLRRYVPDTERIIAIAPFAVVYIFSPDSQQWEKSGHEGTLFVCQLAAIGYGYPRYNVVMLNRKSLDNFITELVSGDNVEVTEQYVILQVLADDGTPNIYGLWIFSDEDAPDTRQLVANAIQECAVRAEYAHESPGESNNGLSGAASYHLDGAADSSAQDDFDSMPPQSTGQQIDLLSLFNNSAPQSQQISNQNGLTDYSASMPLAGQPSKFHNTADTDFFRASQSSAAAVEEQKRPPQQQNALLDLFKSASKG